MLVGAYQRADEYPAGTRAGSRGAFYADRITEKGIEVGKAFVELAASVGLSAAQLAVLWCKDQPGITAPLVGVGSVKHLEDRIPVLDMSLDESVRAACDELVAPGTHVANFFNTSGWMRTSTG